MSYTYCWQDTHMADIVPIDKASVSDIYCMYRGWGGGKGGEEGGQGGGL